MPTQKLKAAFLTETSSSMPHQAKRIAVRRVSEHIAGAERRPGKCRQGLDDAGLGNHIQTPSVTL